ncbi:Nitric oxide synthase-interacting protein like [Argiope bruennichi]|uniref:Nitric oxide synthase-interacting protein like n=1 Tax=Argiope bruennichi TaxID=94029 RepID=A0A8T0EPD1_ARGBR|nr:Nitric oxide synthase-interacting protein like [Argiope bruennichi]
MTRHARNCTAGAVYTYHEKKKDNKAGGYGTIQNRIGRPGDRDVSAIASVDDSETTSKPNGSERSLLD